MRKNIGVILAGGKGKRFGTVPPKQFAFIGDKMIIEYTIENLKRAKKVDEIYITINPKYKELGYKLAEKYKHITKIIEGGRTRTESIYNSSLEVNEEVKKVVFIDAVRPFVPPHVFDEFMRLLDKYGVVKFCSKIVDYLAFTGDSEFIERTDNRDKWRLCKAPVGYQSEILKRISKIPREEVLKFESDLGLVLSKVPNTEIYAYESSEFNFKITYKEDLQLAKLLLKHHPRNT
ncbi:2-C-methyl-D-erythritol 4-phosphate cytidylyltransferase [Thermococcus sp.]|uniref:2-C-methyl-D-erythritol 4-phosphate cytidylyltransferase n=1 Tax=Thermococcus sp. TaxID=35749 RepID=UPI00261FF36E|nr:2-C-methyl-D-erythritol 4-phosphate cytidylyltransferase [Thermococcus sp.]